ncbi:MAG: hypothetical protein M1814_004736 [Vezdaea aestivalis]|nr:MAG: hypothetical protein M1814_004736 [Vezdaea aestivalis]
MATSNGAQASNHLALQSRSSRSSPGSSGSIISDPIVRPSNVPRHTSRPHNDAQTVGSSEPLATGEPLSRVKGQSSKDSINSRRSARRVTSIDNDKILAKDYSRHQMEATLATIKTLKADIETLRSIVTCKICTRLLYEPYTVSCGHTFCYFCLRQWFSEHQTKKTCPECRADVKQPPAPAFLVRELMETFISRTELLPAEESVDDHRRLRQEANDCVENDRVNKDPRHGGLFRGCFKVDPPGSRAVRAVRDQEDGVDRCPVCGWEIEGNRCAGCGLGFDHDGNAILGRGSFSGPSEYSSAPSYRSEEDFDHDMDIEGFPEEYDYEYGPSMGSGYSVSDQYFAAIGDSVYSIPLQRELAHGNIQRPSRPASRSSYNSRIQRYAQSNSDMWPSEDGSMATVEEVDEDEDEDETESTDLDGFVVGTDVSDLSSHSMTSASLGHGSSHFGVQSNGQPRSTPPNNSVPSHPSSHSMSQSPLAPITGLSHFREESFDEGGPISSGRRRRRVSSPTLIRPHRFGPIALSVSNGAGSEENEMDNEESELEEDEQALLGYLPLEHDDANGSMEYESGEDDDDDDAMTTIGVDSPSSHAAEIACLGGSITPTANRPHPTIRPPSRGTTTFRGRDVSRGLRRKGSTVSVSNYDDEADDDESDFERLELARSGTNHGRHDGSQVSGSSSRRPSTSGGTENIRTQGNSVNDAIEVDSDSTSDQSIQPARRRRSQPVRAPEYNPRISMLFAQHQSDMDSVNSSIGSSEMGSRSRTPVARPRTANRNRGIHQSYHTASPSQSNRDQSVLLSGGSSSGLPFNDPSMRQSVNPPDTVGFAEGESSSRASAGISSFVTTRPTLTSNLLGSTQSRNTRPTTPLSSNGNAFSPTSVGSSLSPRSVASIPDRPVSRAAVTNINSNYQSRPGSGQGRSHGASNIELGRSTVALARPFNGVGLPRSRPHPWTHLISRPSNARLREAPSNATLRARSSRSHMRNQSISSPNTDHQSANSSPTVRPQLSRSSLTHVPSHQRLRTRHSSRALQATQQALGSNPVSGPSQGLMTSPPDPAAINAVRQLSAEERRQRGIEMVRQRQVELQQQERQFDVVNRSEASVGSSAALSPPVEYQRANRRSLNGMDQGQSFSERSAVSRSSTSIDHSGPQRLSQNDERSPRNTQVSNIQANIGQTPSLGPNSPSSASNGSMRSGTGSGLSSNPSAPIRNAIMSRVR